MAGKRAKKDDPEKQAEQAHDPTPEEEAQAERDLLDRERREQREQAAGERAEGEVLAGTEGGIPDPSIQPGTGTVTDPMPGRSE